MVKKIKNKNANTSDEGVFHTKNKAQLVFSGKNTVKIYVKNIFVKLK